MKKLADAVGRPLSQEELRARRLQTEAIVRSLEKR